MDKDSYNVVAHLNQILKNNSTARRLKNLGYPFLFKLSRKHTQAWRDEIHQLNLLAHQAFEPGESLEEPEKVVEWQTASPDSWLIYKEDGVIRGFIHAEPLEGVVGDRIRQNTSHEGLISSNDIKKPKLLSSTDYIHIGSIISNASKSKRQRVALTLLAGIVDRILDLYSPHQGGVHRVLAVDYPDANGEHHARQLFKRYGFNHTQGELTAEKPLNPVYVLDLNDSPTPDRLELEQAVLAIRARYRYRKKRRRRTVLFLIAILFLIIAAVSGYNFGWIPAAASGSLSLISTLVGIITALRSVPELNRLLKT